MWMNRQTDTQTHAAEHRTPATAVCVGNEAAHLITLPDVDWFSTDCFEDPKDNTAFHTRYRALGPELIPVYRQSARR